MNAVGEGALSNERSATPSAPATVPAAPSLNSATGGNNSVSLGWSAGSNGGSAITGYRVYRGTVSGGETLLATVGVVTSYTDATALNGTDVFLQGLGAERGRRGCAFERAVGVPSAPATVPGAPSLNSATGGNNSVSLGWSGGLDGGSAITGYKVYRGTSAGGETLLASLGLVTGYTDATAVNGVTYFYKVSAVNAIGEGGLSNERSATPSAPLTVPGAPSLNSATGGNNSVSLGWSAGSTGGSAITGYRVYRGTSAGGETLLASLGLVTGYTDATAVNGVTYFYKVSAVNAVGEGGLSNERSATPSAPLTVPGAPTLSSATGGNNSVSLGWSAGSTGGSAITGYRVYRGTVSGGETLLATVGVVTSYTDATAVNGVIYFYKLSAVNAVGEGTLSNEMSATPSTSVTAPNAPSLNAAVAGNNAVSLSWTPGATGGSAITGYRVYRGTVSGGETLLTSIGDVTSFMDTTAVNGTVYFYKVSALNAVGESTRSNERSATPSGPATVPGAPTLNSATGGNNSVTLGWAAGANGGSAITGYKVYRGTTAGGESLLATLGLVTSYADATALNGTVYFYKVSAVNAVGEGGLSNERSATPSAPATVPGAPSLNSATGGNNSVTLGWAAGANGGSAITGYKVYRGTTAGGESLLASLGLVTGYTDATALNGTVYFYKVSAVNAIGESGLSNELVGAPSAPATVPGAPSLNSATGGNASVALAWSAPGSNGGSAITGYRVYRGTSAGGETLLASLGLVTGYTDATAVNGVTYFYKVSAVNAIGEGGLSNERSATPSAPLTVPGAPTLNSATGGNNSVSLGWSAGANGGSAITGYKVYRGTVSGGETLLATLGVVTGYTDATAVNGVIYFYKLSAVNAVGEGTLSNEMSATPSAPLTVPGAPTLSSATGGNNSVSLGWSAGSNGGSAITGYRVYRGTVSGGETLLATVGVVTSYTDATAVNGVIYFYKLSAVNAVGEGTLSNEMSATPSTSATAPNAPSLNSAVAGNNAVSLSWTPGSNGGSTITGYRVYRGTAAGGETLLTSIGDVTSFMDTTAVNGTVYFYKVSALNAVGESTRSNERSATPSGPATVPGAPTLNSATGGNNSVTLGWAAGANGGSAITGYKVYRGTTAGGESLLATLGLVTSYADATALNGTVYFYKVSAVNAVGEGGLSNERSATPSAPATVPGAPTLNSATGGNNSVTLGWSAGSTGGSAITGYNVYRGTSSGGQTLLTLSPLGVVTGYTDATAVNGVTYFYKVTALNAVGESVRSNELSATPSAPATVPAAPSLNSATGGNGNVALAWSAPGANGGSAITGYKVYRGTSAGSETLLTSVGLVTGYTDAAAVNGVTYFYKVSAVNAVGEGGLSNERSATPSAPATVPGAPTLNSATGGNNAVSLAWTAGANGGSAIMEYKVYRGTVSGGETLLATLGLVTSWVDTSALNGTVYFYKVSAVNAVGEGGLSSEMVGVPSAPATVPGAPTLNSATGGNNLVTLGWSAPGSNGGSAITGYRVYRGTVSGGETLLATLGVVTSYVDATAVNGVTYFYKVSAVNAVGEGVLSNERSATPSASATAPNAPSLNAAVAGNNAVSLSWTPGSNGGSAITGYRVYRGTAAGGETLLTSIGDVTSFMDTTAVNGTVYFYKVSALNAVGESTRSNERSATPSGPATVPGAPTLNSATGGNNSVTLGWAAGANGGSAITGYKVYRGTTAGGESLLATLGLVTSYADATAVNGVSYFYKVSAVNAVGEGVLSNELSATPSVQATVPGAPSLNSATGGNGSVALAWSAPGANGGSPITSYKVYRGTSAGDESLLASVGVVTSFMDATAVNGVTYFYKVSAVNAIGESILSNERSATPSAPLTVPGAPTLNSATGGNNSVTLGWSAGSTGGSAITGYKVYRGTVSGGETLLATLGVVTSYADATAVNGTVYFYKVSAVNAVGEGVISNELSATPSAPVTVPGAPSLNSATGGNNSVSLGWGAGLTGGSAITGYRVYRGTVSGGETLLATLGLVTSWVDTSALNGTVYFYKVSAVNAVGEGVLSNERSAMPSASATAPNAPSLNAAVAGNNAVSLSWTPGSNGGSATTGYRVYRGTVSGGETLLMSIGGVTSFMDVTAVNGTVYFYKVSAVNAIGESVLSNERSATPSGPATVPAAPSLNSATAGNNSVSLGWSAGANGGSAITGYKVYRGTSAGGETLLATLGVVTGYTDATAVNGVAYFYKVSAVNAVGEGSLSNERSATPSVPATVPGAPS